MHAALKCARELSPRDLSQGRPLVNADTQYPYIFKSFRGCEEFGKKRLDRIRNVKPKLEYFTQKFLGGDNEDQPLVENYIRYLIKCSKCTLNAQNCPETIEEPDKDTIEKDQKAREVRMERDQKRLDTHEEKKKEIQKIEDVNELTTRYANSVGDDIMQAIIMQRIMDVTGSSLEDLATAAA